MSGCRALLHLDDMCCVSDVARCYGTFSASRSATICICLRFLLILLLVHVATNYNTNISRSNTIPISKKTVLKIKQ